jgi:hypothetical protein
LLDTTQEMVYALRWMHSLFVYISAPTTEVYNFV